ncbi:DcaP family trimeric outer membrane transporter [Arhodomonas aquaeolei]|uniref:DcaP family trimeric outer membrane transporter n=1 Tax=Arhodomonas aquaeolei TaxID=2369 RepID=UPI0003734CD5|nr:DcaP family trimeric outer membrane transporter [Arhodomonas aquaeolei]
MARHIIKGAAIGTVSALALAAAGQAAAVDFQAGDTTVSIYGYAIGKMSYDVDEQLGDATQGNFGNLVDDEDADGYSDIDATQSRVGFQTSTDMEGSDLVTRIEGDFRGNGGGGFRLRHAYGSWNGVLAGQTWSNYNSFVGNTATLDFNSLAGTAGYQLRTAQFRYTIGDFSVALEDPQTNIYSQAAGGTSDDYKKDSLPALSARYEGSQGRFGYSVAGIVRQIEDAEENDDAMGYGGFVAGSYDMGAFSFQGTVNYVDGATSYLYQSGYSDFNAPDAYIEADGDLETVSAWGGSVGVSADAGPGTVNLSYGRVEVDDSDDVSSAGYTTPETNQNVFLNYMWQPVERVTYGIEYSYWKTEADNGDDADANRVSVAAQYVF